MRSARGGVLAILLAWASAAACGLDANNCQRQLDLCLRQAPPGAAVSECYAQYDACTRMPRRGQQSQAGAAEEDEEEGR